MRGCQIGPDDKKIGLDHPENFFNLIGEFLGSYNPKNCIEFIDGSECFYPKSVLRDPYTSEKSRFSGVTGFCINFRGHPADFFPCLTLPKPTGNPESSSMRKADVLIPPKKFSRFRNSL